MRFSLLYLFKVIAILEGISYILLLFIAVPIKYMADEPKYVKLLGMPHGLLFVAYIVLALIIGKKFKLRITTTIWLLIYSVVPMAAFYAERNLIEKNIHDRD